jgi:FkbM family methyltransferase
MAIWKHVARLERIGGGIERIGGSYARNVAAELTVRAVWKAGAAHGNTVARVVDGLLTRGDVAVDVGACWGLFSRRALQLVGHAGTVYAIEPNPSARPALERLKRHHPNFYYCLAAASHELGTATLHIPRQGNDVHAALATLRPPDADVAVDTVRVPLIRLDDLLAGELAPISLIKVDVEGHELAVLAGATATLEKKPRLLIEIEQRHHSEPIDRVFAHLLDRGFEAWALFPSGLVPLDEFDVDRDQLRYVTGGLQNAMPRGYVNDFLFVPPGSKPFATASGRE